MTLLRPSLSRLQCNALPVHVLCAVWWVYKEASPQAVTEGLNPPPGVASKEDEKEHLCFALIFGKRSWIEGGEEGHELGRVLVCVYARARESECM